MSRAILAVLVVRTAACSHNHKCQRQAAIAVVGGVLSVLAAIRHLDTPPMQAASMQSAAQATLALESVDDQLSLVKFLRHANRFKDEQIATLQEELQQHAATAQEGLSKLAGAACCCSPALSAYRLGLPPPHATRRCPMRMQCRAA